MEERARVFSMYAAARRLFGLAETQNMLCAASGQTPCHDWTRNRLVPPSKKNAGKKQDET